MAASALHRPDTVAEACELLAADADAMAYGGGTAIQILRKQRVLFASSFVDLSRVAGLDELSAGDGYVRAGPMVTIRRMETHPLVRKHAPLAATACGNVASPRVRNTATIGGNIAHGDHRLDPPVALLALGAAVEVTSVRGSRTIAAADFFVDFLQTALAPGELITAITIPAPPPGAAWAYVKLSSLSANDWPCASAAALLARDDSGGLRLRLGLGALAPVPRLAEIDVTGRREDEAVEAALAAAGNLMDPIADIRGSAAYKRTLGQVAVEDAVRQTWKEAGRD